MSRSTQDKRDRKNLDQALVLLDLIRVTLCAQTEARAQACAALFAPFDPFWPDRKRPDITPGPRPQVSPQTSKTMPSRANSQSTE